MSNTTVHISMDREIRSMIEEYVLIHPECTLSSICRSAIFRFLESNPSLKERIKTFKEKKFRRKEFSGSDSIAG